MLRNVSATCLAACAALMCSASNASAPSSFSPFIGAWSGAGQIRLDNGRSEQIKCRAYFTEQTRAMGLALRCASAGSKIDLRAQLTNAGGRVSGTWEERQFNASGSLTGTQSATQTQTQTGVQAVHKLALAMEGGGLKASVTIAAEGPAQAFTISTDAGTVRGAQISLLRDAGP